MIKIVERLLQPKLQDFAGLDKKVVSIVGPLYHGVLIFYQPMLWNNNVKVFISFLQRFEVKFNPHIFQYLSLEVEGQLQIYCLLC